MMLVCGLHDYVLDPTNTIEVKWNTVVVSRTNEVKYIDSSHFYDCSVDAIVQTKCQNIKLKIPLQSQQQVALNAIYKISIAPFSFTFVNTGNTIGNIQN